MELLTVERIFTVEAPANRVWELLGRAIFDSLPGLERMKVIDENNFRAALKTRVFSIPLSMYLRGEMTDISPPTYLSVELSACSKWNLISLIQKINFTLDNAGDEKTKIACQAFAVNLNPLFRWLLLGHVKSQAKQIFASIEERFKQWT